MRFDYRDKSTGPRTFDLIAMGDDDHIGATIRETGTFYEIDLLEYMRFVARRCRLPRGLCIDVGANIGNHSTFFGAFLARHVLSVEPNATVLPLLERNLRENVENYTIASVAAGRAAGRGSLHLPEEARNNLGMMQVVADPSGERGSIPLTTVDALVAGLPQAVRSCAVTLIKIDVEGMELDVLEGAAGTLERWRPHLFIEAATPTHKVALETALTQIGYVRLTQWAATPVLHFMHAPDRLTRLALRGYAWRFHLRSRALRLLRGGSRAG